MGVRKLIWDHLGGFGRFETPEKVEVGSRQIWAVFKGPWVGLFDIGDEKLPNYGEYGEYYPYQPISIRECHMSFECCLFIS